jgi:hypothetical protein
MDIYAIVTSTNFHRQLLVMFRARFHDAFPPKLAEFGPQDIENGVVDTIPSENVEHLLCALLTLVHNRKKPVEYVTLEPHRFRNNTNLLRWME